MFGNGFGVDLQIESGLRSPVKFWDLGARIRKFRTQGQGLILCIWCAGFRENDSNVSWLQ